VGTGLAAHEAPIEETGDAELFFKEGVPCYPNHHLPAVIQATHPITENKLFCVSLMFKLSRCSGERYKERGFAWKGTMCQRNSMGVVSVSGDLAGLHCLRGKINLSYSQRASGVNSTQLLGSGFY